MSLQTKVLNLLSGVRDPVLRMDVASTIFYLADIFASGNAKEGDVRRALYEVCTDVIRATRPDLVDEEVREEAERMTNELIAAFRTETLRRRISTRFRARGLPMV